LEREEWLVDGEYYQVNGSGIDSIPEQHQSRYKQFVANIDWPTKQNNAHKEIWSLHQELAEQNIRHVFFNGNNHFGDIPESARFDWGPNYISPYDAGATYDQWLRRHGHDTVAPNSWHFGRSAHAAWSRFVLQYCIANRII
jgi:hypothetical protein